MTTVEKLREATAILQACYVGPNPTKEEREQLKAAFFLIKYHARALSEESKRGKK